MSKEKNGKSSSLESPTDKNIYRMPSPGLFRKVEGDDVIFFFRVSKNHVDLAFDHLDQEINTLCFEAIVSKNDDNGNITVSIPYDSVFLECAQNVRVRKCEELMLDILKLMSDKQIPLFFVMQKDMELIKVNGVFSSPFFHYGVEGRFSKFRNPYMLRGIDISVEKIKNKGISHPYPFSFKFDFLRKLFIEIAWRATLPPPKESGLDDPKPTFVSSGKWESSCSDENISDILNQYFKHNGEGFSDVPKLIAEVSKIIALACQGDMEWDYALEQVKSIFQKRISESTDNPVFFISEKRSWLKDAEIIPVDVEQFCKNKLDELDKIQNDFNGSFSEVSDDKIGFGKSFN